MQVLAVLCLLVLVVLISAQDTSVNERREATDLIAPEQRPEEYGGFLRSFRSAAANGKPTFIRFGKRAQPSFIRFGKRAQPSFIRFGRSSLDY